MLAALALAALMHGDPMTAATPVQLHIVQSYMLGGRHRCPNGYRRARDNRCWLKSWATPRHGFQPWRR